VTEYNPFDKPFSEVNAGDIYGLDVPEGYYCEYKRDMVDNTGIAKAISSFANTYGGLLFIGIKEGSESNKPEDWFTLAGGDPTKYKETVRNVVKDYVSPPPRFTTHSFKGSSQDGSDGYVLMVDVPESHITPHINNDGCVYRRTGEGSDPYRPLTDPGVLDELNKRRQQWEQRVEEFCQTEVGVTETFLGNSEYNIEGIPMLEVYAIPTTLDDPVCSDVRLDLDKFKKVVQSSDLHFLPEDSELSKEDVEIEMGMDADSYRATSEGVVAQQWITHDEFGEKDRAHTPLTVKFFADGSAKFFTPVPVIPFPKQSERTRTWTVVENALDSSYEDIQFVDGKQTLTNLYNLLNIHLNLLLEYEWPAESNSLFIKARLTNGYRTMLFFEANWYRDLLQDYGPPVCYDEVVEAPRMNPFQYEIDASTEKRMSSVNFAVVSILQSFGLPLQKYENVFEYLVNHIFREGLDDESFDVF
jgi:hypothetical protein